MVAVVSGLYGCVSCVRVSCVYGHVYVVHAATPNEIWVGFKDSESILCGVPALHSDQYADCTAGFQHLGDAGEEHASILGICQEGRHLWCWQSSWAKELGPGTSEAVQHQLCQQQRNKTKGVAHKEQPCHLPRQGCAAG